MPNSGLSAIHSQTTSRNTMTLKAGILLCEFEYYSKCKGWLSLWTGAVDVQHQQMLRIFAGVFGFDVLVEWTFRSVGLIALFDGAGVVASYFSCCPPQSLLFIRAVLVGWVAGLVGRVIFVHFCFISKFPVELVHFLPYLLNLRELKRTSLLFKMN